MEFYMDLPIADLMRRNNISITFRQPMNNILNFKNTRDTVTTTSYVLVKKHPVARTTIPPQPPAPLFDLHEYFQPVFDEVDNLNNLNKMLDSHIGEEKREKEKEMTTAIKAADNSTHACQYSSSSSLLPLLIQPDNNIPPIHTHSYRRMSLK
jgi:hypothetical protein